VRQRLSRLVSDRAPQSLHFRSPQDAQRWLEEMDRRLALRMPDRQQRRELLRAVHYESVRARLDPQLVLGLIEVESSFRKYAVSSAGARGYMQVMPFWVKLIGQPNHNLFHLRTNLAYGCAILRHYLDMEKGDYWRALGRYNGSLGKPEYPSLVLSAWKGRWKYDGPPA
jgi:soluble lytic murein transglycosylase-like protein